jgi:serine/threonine-protein kinase Chk2
MLNITEYIKEGVSSHVFECFNSITNEVIIAKVYKRKDCFMNCFFNELKWISSFNHPAIIAYKGCSKQDGYGILFMEKCDHDLFDEVQIRGALTIEEVRSRFKLIFDAVSFIHSNDAAHGDIKLENIGVMKDGDLKLLDFGSCCSIHSSTIQNSGTLFYLSPEAESKERDLKKCDILALGITIFACVAGMFPFYGEGKKYFDEVVYSEPYFSIITSMDEADEFISLLQGMLMKDPNKRFTIEDCLSHSFFAK